MLIGASKTCCSCQFKLSDALVYTKTFPSSFSGEPTAIIPLRRSTAISVAKAPPLVESSIVWVLETTICSSYFPVFSCTVHLPVPLSSIQILKPLLAALWAISFASLRSLALTDLKYVSVPVSPVKSSSTFVSVSKVILSWLTSLTLKKPFVLIAVKVASWVESSGSKVVFLISIKPNISPLLISLGVPFILILNPVSSFKSSWIL